MKAFSVRRGQGFLPGAKSFDHLLRAVSGKGRDECVPDHTRRRCEPMRNNNRNAEARFTDRTSPAFIGACGELLLRIFPDLALSCLEVSAWL
jgi:hypothetical protein